MAARHYRRLSEGVYVEEPIEDARRRLGYSARRGRLELVRPSEPSPGVMALAHLLACLDHAVELLNETGADVDARVVEAHRAQLARGREWPGDTISAPDLDGGG